jgi:hypothetical protein
LPPRLKVQHPQLLGLIPAINGKKVVDSSNVCSMHVINILLFQIYVYICKQSNGRICGMHVTEFSSIIEFQFDGKHNFWNLSHVHLRLIFRMHVTANIIHSMKENLWHSYCRFLFV